MFLAESMKYMIVLFAVGTAYQNILYLVRVRKLSVGYWWIKFGISMVSLFWGVYYGLSIFDISLNVPPHQVLVRGGVLMTLAFLFAGASISARRLR